MADAADLKSASRKGVWVRVPPSAKLELSLPWLSASLSGSKSYYFLLSSLSVWRP